MTPIQVFSNIQDDMTISSGYVITFAILALFYVIVNLLAKQESV